ncbi:Zn-ribbon domain-containing OB-fold protein [Mycobacterium deserti]|uniref:OB-fold domain-containing protein n=1 Tax=Mycobacterium deserti TaxID=2978347 RepID=A0ABT2MBQ9_9MYCO|nr:OB-fold domain-containing protein [Mycobacterium deserti]MCT7659004.1 OB-fold domain-containing protein [Mycobacterium deserti]
MASPAGPNRPTVDTDSEIWWAAVQDRKLLINTCGSCGRNSLYARPFCPHCWSEDVRLAPATGRAALYTWSVVHQNAPPFDTHLPYTVAMVDLEEGPRLMTLLVDCEQPCAGQKLALDFRTDDEDGFEVPVFRPVDEKHREERA